MRIIFSLIIASLLLPWTAAAETFRVASYNVQNYLDQPTASRHFVKSDEAKAKIRESIKAANPDVLALEEMGSTNALMELRASLAADGLEFPFWEHIQSFDTNIHVAVLSRLPIVARHPHTNENFLLDGKRMQVKRGFAEVEIQVATNFNFTLLVAHLKSRLPTPDADEKQQRLEEAKILRGILDEKLKADPVARLVVAGDLNDDKESDSTREIMGKGRGRLFDTRPAERGGSQAVWTHFYGKLDEYSRIDFILTSPAMRKFWRPEGSYIPVVPRWDIGSDHRPVVAEFSTTP
jgi:endonuclease/exonuclease/phosphatase family metal-dependent hydrolase